MKKIEIEEIKELQLNILDKVAEFCKQRNLRMSLAFGTLIGAVRHKGYIPWDDDIDIMMPYPDYKILLEEFPGRDKDLSVQSFDNDEKYRFPFAKVYDNRTVLFEKTIKTGVYIDIFPVIRFPEFAEFRGMVAEYKKLYRSLKKMSCLYNLSLWGKLMLAIRKLYKPSREQITEHINAIYSRYPFDSARYAGVIPVFYKDKRHFKADIFRTYVPLLFEGREYLCVKDYDTLLSGIYGDYMTLPPEKERHSAHIYKAYWL